jgi:spoIIIJ-associated protein
MEYVETEGDSIDEAIERALARLGATRDRVEIEILSNVSKGLFGLGGRKARVRATLRSPIRFDGGEDESLAATDPAGADEPPAARPEARPIRAEDRVRQPPLARPQAGLEAPALERSQAVLQEVVRLIGSEARVRIEDDGDGPRLVIDGDESGLLIGRRGQTLDALEYVLNRIVTREDEGGTRLVVDSQNYRTRRRQSLVDLAHRLGERARRRGKTVTLNPMSPRDRRVVHLALQDDPSLTTRSSGRGYYRKLLIIPGGERRARPRRNERRGAAPQGESREDDS